MVWLSIGVASNIFTYRNSIEHMARNNYDAKHLYYCKRYGLVDIDIQTMGYMVDYNKTVMLTSAM